MVRRALRGGASPGRAAVASARSAAKSTGRPTGHARERRDHAGAESGRFQSGRGCRERGSPRERVQGEREVVSLSYWHLLVVNFSKMILIVTY